MALHLDTSYIGPYLQDWLLYIRESTRSEQQLIEKAEEFRIPFAGAQPDMIDTLFKISHRYRIEPHAKYLAVHLLDRYLGQYFWELVKNCGELSPGSMQQVRNKISCGIKTDLASCLMIASKVDLFKTGLAVSQIQEMLQTIDPSRAYSKQSIILSEMRILRTLEFRLPLCLPIHAVEIFLAFADLTSKTRVRDTCFQLLDIAYLRHDDLFSQLHLLARGKKLDRSSVDCRDFLGLEVDSLFIGAAVVVCSCFFFHMKRRSVETLTSKLGNLVQISAVDINIFANILFTFALDEEDFEKLHRNGEISNSSR